jgi:hypothetical protein
MDFTNYYEVAMNRALNAANDRLALLEEKIIPLAKRCLKEEKGASSRKMYQRRVNSWWWPIYQKMPWAMTPGQLMIWCVDNPGEELGMFDGWEVGYVVTALESIQSDIGKIQMNCARVAGEPAKPGVPMHRAILQQNQHAWLFADDPWMNILDRLSAYLDDKSGKEIWDAVRAGDLDGAVE